MVEHDCPVCGTSISTRPRYPDEVCEDCASRATDRLGRPVRLFNESMSGGFLAQYSDGSQASAVTSDHTVFIDNVAFHADEARMGGIVVRPIA